ncbi:MAG: hypothetical protein DHS20C15_30870 [Planctomycetota bacterium]|nr:MAG: hypothetical protein DHS20C15_30870 [Planctomycetota bacterium]
MTLEAAVGEQRTDVAAEAHRVVDRFAGDRSVAARKRDDHAEPRATSVRRGASAECQRCMHDPPGYRRERERLAHGFTERVG